MKNKSIPDNHSVSPYKKEKSVSLMDVKPKHIYKVAVVGDTGVGKTSYIQSYVNGFPLMAMGSTLGVNFHTLYVDVDSDISKVNIWDTAGQDRFKSIIKLYLKNIHGIVIIYDVYVKDCKAYLESWYEVVKEENPNIYICVACNKCDEFRKANNEQRLKFEKNISIGETFCETHELSFFTMSVSTYENVVDVMNYLIFEIETNPKDIDLVPMTYRSNSVEFRNKRERENTGGYCC